MSDHYLVYCLKKLNGAHREDQKIIETRSMKTLMKLLFSLMCLKLTEIEQWQTY